MTTRVRTTINNHVDEAPTIAAVASDTKEIFNTIWQSLGASARPTFEALKTALDNVLVSINKIQNDTAIKKNALNDNKALVDNSIVRIVTPSVPDTNAAIATINNTISGYTSIDLTRLNAAVGVSRQVRSPSDVTSFEKQKIQQISARLSELVAQASLSRDYVLSMKKLVEDKLAEV